MESPLCLLYLDWHCAVVDKPGGLLAVPGRGPGKEDSVASRVRRRFAWCIPQPAVHRLDMDTSGLMVFALNASAHRHFSRQFAERKVEKEYLALVEGRVAPAQGVIRLAFRLDPARRPHQMYDPQQGKEGITQWRRLKYHGDRTLLACRPLTGRTHQIRLHASHPLGLGLAIVGDRLYGRGQPGDTLHLHASRLAFWHPCNGKWLQFYSAPPAWALE